MADQPKSEAPADRPDFDLSGMVETALAEQRWDDAGRILLEGVLVTNRNFEALAQNTADQQAMINGVIRGAQALGTRLATFEARMQRLEHALQGKRLS